MNRNQMYGVKSAGLVLGVSIQYLGALAAEEEEKVVIRYLLDILT